MKELSNIITDALAENGFIAFDDYAVCQYGINVFLISTAGIGFVLFVSLFLKNSIETLLWLITFIPIRIYAGGYHADTRLNCFLAFIAVYLIFSVMLINLPIYTGLYLFMTWFTMLAIFRWAPVQHKNKHVSESEKVFFRKTAISFATIEGVVATVTLLLNIHHVYSMAVVYGLFTAGISLLAGKIKNYFRSENHEQKEQGNKNITDNYL